MKASKDRWSSGTDGLGSLPFAFPLSALLSSFLAQFIGRLFSPNGRNGLRNLRLHLRGQQPQKNKRKLEGF